MSNGYIVIDVIIISLHVSTSRPEVSRFLAKLRSPPTVSGPALVAASAQGLLSSSMEDHVHV